MLFVVHIFASWNYCSIHPEPTANEGEDNQKVWLVKKKNIDPGYDRAYIYLDRSLCTYVAQKYADKLPHNRSQNHHQKEVSSQCCICFPLLSRHSALLSFRTSFDVRRVRSRGSCVYGCKHNQCLLYVRNQPPQSKRKQRANKIRFIFPVK